jgi:hypothetical protein
VGCARSKKSSALSVIWTLILIAVVGFVLGFTLPMVVTR